MLFTYTTRKNRSIINGWNKLLRTNQHIHSRFPTNFDWVSAPSINDANAQSAVLGVSSVFCSLEVFVKLRPLNSPNLFLCGCQSNTSFIRFTFPHPIISRKRPQVHAGLAWLLAPTDFFFSWGGLTDLVGQNFPLLVNVFSLSLSLW